MEHDLIDRQAVVPATVNELNCIMMELMSGSTVRRGRQIDYNIAEKLKEYATRLNNAIACIPSAGFNTINASLDDVGVLCQGLINSGYSVRLDPGGKITYWEREYNA